MTLSRYTTAALSLALCGALAAPAANAAEDYPQGPVRLIVGYSAGGATDIVSRIFADRLSPLLGQPVIVENRPGAAGTVAAQEFLTLEPDGHTLLVVAASHTFYPLTTAEPVYQLEDFKTIGLLGVASNVFATDPDLPVDDFAGFLALLRDNPGQYFHGSSGVGSTSHFSSELFQQLADVDMVHVPFPGSARALQAVMGGEIAMHMDTMSTAMPHHEQGTIRILAIAAEERDPGAPDIPTATEAGLPGMVSNTYYALVGQADLSDAIVDKIASAWAEIRADEGFQQRMRELRVPTSDASPEETMQFMLNETAIWRDVAERAGLGPQ
ncbi:MAG: tripartite tricarboxylate transporter substrate binding protein [Salinarimonadaceae bacterium]|nr:MAG: tripartite tricarboxylate transporter substrate binding protein [Salinarimonadaceae bacterium]